MLIYVFTFKEKNLHVVGLESLYNEHDDFMERYYLQSKRWIITMYI